MFGCLGSDPNSSLVGDLCSILPWKVAVWQSDFLFCLDHINEGFLSGESCDRTMTCPKDQGEVASSFILAWLGSQTSPDMTDVTSDHWILPNEHLQHIQCFRLSIWNHFMMLENEEKTWCHQVIFYDFLGLLILTRTQSVKLVSSQRKDKQLMVRWSSKPPNPNHQFTTIVG